VTLPTFAAALAIGVSLGVFGGGGSILTVPALVYLGGLAPFEATTASLVVVGLTSGTGALQHARRGHLDLRAALLFVATGIPGSFAGSMLSRRVPGRELLLAFAGVMIAAGITMLFRRTVETGERVSAVRVLVPGAAVGLLTGFFGIGGGFLIVPALVLFAGVPMIHAVGTSLMVIAVNCLSGFAGRYATSIDWRGTLIFSAVAIGGSFAGAFFATRMPAAWLRRGFAVFILGLAAFMIVRESPR
jgi:uncharacterized membrane protein YfcA